MLKNQPSRQQTEPTLQDSKQRSRVQQRTIAVAILCLFGYLVVLIFTIISAGANEIPFGWLITYCVAALLAVGAGWCLYHALFAMAEARWPFVKVIRAILGLIIGALSLLS